MDATDVDEVLLMLQDLCDSAISAFKRELQRIRTGRASAGLLEGIDVEYYGSKTPLQHLGQISSPEPRQLNVQVFDTGAVEAVEKAIRSSDLGFNPSREGNTLRINVPPLTQESRKEIVRMLHKLAEDMRISIRNHRRDANDTLKKLEKDNVLTKDEGKRGMDKVQECIDSHISMVDKMLSVKEAEIMEV
jgi:ribosome recycling factor